MISVTSNCGGEQSHSRRGVGCTVRDPGERYGGGLGMGETRGQADRGGHQKLDNIHVFVVSLSHLTGKGGADARQFKPNSNTRR